LKSLFGTSKQLGRTIRAIAGFNIVALVIESSPLNASIRSRLPPAINSAWDQFFGFWALISVPILLTLAAVVLYRHLRRTSYRMPTDLAIDLGLPAAWFGLTVFFLGFGYFFFR
jgi:hypothetical protein